MLRFDSRIRQVCGPALGGPHAQGVPVGDLGDTGRVHGHTVGIAFARHETEHKLVAVNPERSQTSPHGRHARKNFGSRQGDGAVGVRTRHGARVAQHGVVTRLGNSKGQHFARTSVVQNRSCRHPGSDQLAGNAHPDVVHPDGQCSGRGMLGQQSLIGDGVGQSQVAVKVAGGGKHTQVGVTELIALVGTRSTVANPLQNFRAQYRNSHAPRVTNTGTAQ